MIQFIVLSHINVLLENKIRNSDLAFHMLKLNKRKIRWIMRQMDKKELSTYMIAKIQKITPRHARRVYAKYKGVKDPILLPCGLLPCGSKPRLITKED